MAAANGLCYKIIGHLGKLLARNQTANKVEARELEKDLALMTQPDADALVEAGTLELLLRYLTVEQHFEVVTKCLIALSSFDSARNGMYDMKANGIVWLSDYTIQQCKAVKGEKQIERSAVLCKILVLYCVDVPDSELSWLVELADLLTNALARAHTKVGMQDSYNYMSIVLPSMWVSMNTSLAPIMAAHIINAGAFPLLLNVARDVQRVDLKGLPKIIGEKALNLLVSCNAEQPNLSLTQVSAEDMAAFCVETTIKSDWVQSQELSVVLLGRMVYSQHALPTTYLERSEVVTMLQHAMKSKSPALRMTAFCLSSVCNEAVFEAVCIEANQVIMDLAEGSQQSIKRLATPTAGGMTIMRWGVPLNKFAKDLLRGTKLLERMAEVLPVTLPPQLVDLLQGELYQYVTGIQAAHGVLQAPTGSGGQEDEEGAGGDNAYAAPPREQGGVPSSVVNQAAAAAGRKPLQPQQPTGSAGPAPGRTTAGVATPKAGLTGGKPTVSLVAGANGSTGGGAAATKPVSRPSTAIGHRGLAAAAEKTTAEPVGIKRARGEDSEGSHSQQDGADVKRTKPAGLSSAGRAAAAPATGAVAQSGAAPGRGSGGGGAAQSGGSVEAGVRSSHGFGSQDLTQLNNLLFELMNKTAGMDPKASTVVQNLMQGVSKLPAVLKYKHKVPADVAAECDDTLRAWAARVRQLSGSLPESQGPSLDMMVQFSNMMLDEITCCHSDLETQVQEAV